MRRHHANGFLGHQLNCVDKQYSCMVLMYVHVLWESEASCYGFPGFLNSFLESMECFPYIELTAGASALEETIADIG